MYRTFLDQFLITKSCGHGRCETFRDFYSKLIMKYTILLLLSLSLASCTVPKLEDEAIRLDRVEYKDSVGYLYLIYSVYPVESEINLLSYSRPMTRRYLTEYMKGMSNDTIIQGFYLNKHIYMKDSVIDYYQDVSYKIKLNYKIYHRK